MNKKLSHQPDILLASDVYAGAQLKTARLAHGWSQGKLGDIVSVSFQQIGKYERGINRMSFSTLQKFATALNLPIEHFLEDGPAETAFAAPPKAPYQADDPLLKAIQEAYGKLSKAERTKLSDYAKTLLTSTADKSGKD